MEDNVSIKRMENPQIELYCECENVTFRTLWSPGFPWQIEAVEENIDTEWKFGRLLAIFNSAKTKFDRIIRRLEREYHQFDETVSKLPEAEKNEKV